MHQTGMLHQEPSAIAYVLGSIGLNASDYLRLSLGNRVLAKFWRLRLPSMNALRLSFSTILRVNFTKPLKGKLSVTK